MTRIDMSEQLNSEPTVDQKLQAAIEDYGRLQIAKAYDRRSLEPERFDEFWAEIKPGCKFELSEDNQLTVNGEHPDHYVEYIRRDNTKIRDKYFARSEKKEGSTQSAPDQQKQATLPKKQAEPECLYISRSQMMNRQFMLQAGAEIGKAIQSGKVKVDDSRAVQDGHEIRKFLSPKEVEPAAQNQVKAMPARKTTEIPHSRLMDRAFLRKVDAEWSDQGGYLKNVTNGNIKVV